MKKIFLLLLLAGFVSGCNVDYGDETISLTYFEKVDNGFGADCTLLSNDTDRYLICCEDESSINADEYTVMVGKTGIFDIPPYFHITFNTSFYRRDINDGSVFGIKESDDVLVNGTDTVLSILPYQVASNRGFCGGTVLASWATTFHPNIHVYELIRDPGSGLIQVYEDSVLEAVCPYTATNRSLQFFYGHVTDSDIVTADATQCTRIYNLDITGNISLVANYNVVAADGLGQENCSVQSNSVIYGDSLTLTPSTQLSNVNGLTAEFGHPVACKSDATGGDEGFSWFGYVGAVCPDELEGETIVWLNSVNNGETFNITVGVEGDNQIYVHVTTDVFSDGAYTLEGVNDASVTAIGADGQLYTASITNLEGDYLFQGLPTQVYDLYVSADGYIPVIRKDQDGFNPSYQDDIWIELVEGSDSRVFDVVINITDTSGTRDLTKALSEVWVCDTLGECEVQGIGPGCDRLLGRFHNTDGNVFFNNQSASKNIVCLYNSHVDWDVELLEYLKSFILLSDSSNIQWNITYSGNQQQEYCVILYDNVNGDAIPGLDAVLRYDGDVLVRGVQAGTVVCANVTQYNGIIQYEAYKDGYHYFNADWPLQVDQKYYEFFMVRRSDNFSSDELYHVGGRVLLGGVAQPSLEVASSCKISPTVTNLTGYYLFNEIPKGEKCDFFCTDTRYDTTYPSPTVYVNITDLDIVITVKPFPDYDLEVLVYNQDETGGFRSYVSGALVTVGAVPYTTQTDGKAFFTGLKRDKAMQLTVSKTDYVTHTQPLDGKSIYVEVPLVKEQDAEPCKVYGYVSYLNGTNNEISVYLLGVDVELLDVTGSLIDHDKTLTEGYSLNGLCNTKYEVSAEYGGSKATKKITVGDSDMRVDLEFMSDEDQDRRNREGIVEFAEAWVFSLGYLIVFLFFIIVFKKFSKEAVK